MKKLFIASLLCLTIATAPAQDFRIGLKGIFNSTWLFNNNISDYGDDIDYVATFGYNSGIATAFYFTENLGVSLDLFYTYHSQIIQGSSQFAGYTSWMDLRYLDVPVLFKVSSEGGPYIEIGPQVSFLLKATEIFSGTFTSYTKDYKSDFNGTNMAGVLGFGYDIPAGDRWQINVGLRFGYGLTDVTKKLSESDAELFPLNSVKLTEGDHSTYSQAAHTAATVPHDYSYQKTSRAFGGLSLGVIYKPNAR